VSFSIGDVIISLPRDPVAQPKAKWRFSILAQPPSANLHGVRATGALPRAVRAAFIVVNIWMIAGM